MDIYTAHSLFTGEKTGVNEPPIDDFDETYRRLGFRVIEEFMADNENPTRFKWSYLAKEDKTADDYWKYYRVCAKELEDSIEGLELWWCTWMDGKDTRLWEEIKKNLEDVLR